MPHVRESRIVLDSGFHAMFSGARIPKPRIQDSISKILPDSGFHNKKFHGFLYMGPDDGRRDVLCDLSHGAYQPLCFPVYVGTVTVGGKIRLNIKPLFNCILVLNILASSKTSPRHLPFSRHNILI